MTSSPVTLKSFIDAAADAVARAIASLQREAERDRALRDAEHRARLAELTAAVAEPGPPGANGANGRDGRDGEPGPRGFEGPAGKLPAVRAWSDGVHYEGEVVCHQGATWQAARDTGREPPHADWTLLAVAGRNGQDGRSFTVRGTWAAGERYQALDVVALNGGSFLARCNDPGNCPGDGWQLIAMQGRQGKPGERGPAGPKGERGAAGEPVVAVSVDAEGLLTLTNGDGSVVTCDLYPVLSRIGAGR